MKGNYYFIVKGTYKKQDSDICHCFIVGYKKLKWAYIRSWEEYGFRGE